jgi:tripeptide aminopeptidase
MDSHNTASTATVDIFGGAEKRELLERFLRYVKINTRSAEDAETFPSTACQWDLLKLLAKEMEEVGVQEVELNEFGYLFGTLPSTLPEGKQAPVIGLLAHVDTYPGTNGENVKPQVRKDYDGRDLPLPGKPGTSILAERNPLLQRCLGHTIITSDGTTLLGADDKAGVAIIMTLAHWLVRHPEVPHGKIRIGFTPDEETGTGIRFFDVGRFGAHAAYTFDGSLLGEIEAETFCGDSATVTLTGFEVHPGMAKDRMVNAIRATADLISRLPKDFLPETTEKRQPYLHPYVVHGEVGQVTLKFIVRGFTVEDLEAREQDLLRIAKETEEAFPGVKADVLIQESYRNMKTVLDQFPEVVNLALEAVRRTGVEPTLSYIRGGTDGSALCFKGLPTPNVFAGGVNFHGHQEWVSLEWMLKSLETGFHLVSLWGERESPSAR